MKQGRVLMQEGSRNTGARETRGAGPRSGLLFGDVVKGVAGTELVPRGGH